MRAGARVFLGWGAEDDPILAGATEEDPGERQIIRPLLVGLALVAVVLGVVVSVVPGLGQRAEYAAERFRAGGVYAAAVLHGRPTSPAPPLPVAVHGTSLDSLL